MFNHARTLLVNLPGVSGFMSSCPGEELIPADYSQLTLPSYLRSIRTKLFGANPDRVMLNYRTFQLLQTIASTELQGHVTALDSRITYQLDKVNLGNDAAFIPKVNRYGGDPSDILTVVGTAASPDISGQSGYGFQIYVVNDGSDRIRTKRLVFPLQEVQDDLVLTNGLSPEYDLAFSGYRFRVNTTNSNAAWTVTGSLRPTLSIPDLTANLKASGEPALVHLFGTTSAEPYLTFKNCWQSHPEVAYQLSGLLLALIYRTEEIRNG